MGESWLYLATVIDICSRRVVGWSIAEHMRTELVTDALEMAVLTRRGDVRGVVFHSDRGAPVHVGCVCGILCCTWDSAGSWTCGVVRQCSGGVVLSGPQA